MNDAELIAVAALAQVDALSMQSENNARHAAGDAPAYSQLYSDASTALEAELRQRGLLP